MAKIDPALLGKLPKSYLEEDIGHQIIVVAIVFLVLQTIAVSLYYISRRLNKTPNGWEWWLFMPIGYIFSTALCICGILIVKLGGAGQHVEAVLIQDPTGGIVMTRNKIDKAVELIDLAAITGSKLVILCLYMRIFNTDRRYQIATYLVGSIIVLTWLAAFILSFSICKPFAFQWDHSIPGGKCGDIMGTYAFISVPNITTDLMMLVLPLPALYRLHVDFATKVGLFATFLTGSIGIVTSILRMTTFFNAADLFKDPTFKCVPTFTYTIVEAGTYMIASCMPTLRPLKRHLFGQRSFTRSLRSFLAKRTKSTVARNSSDYKLEKRDRQPDKINSTAPRVTVDQSCSSMHLSNAGFLKLDDENRSFHKEDLSHESV